MTTTQAHDPTADRGPHLMVLLVGLALIPLLFIGWITIGEYQDVGQTRSLAFEARDARSAVTALDELQLALIDEQSWYTVVIGAQQLGVSLDLIDQLTGIDVAGQFRTARDLTDDALGQAPASDFADRVEVIRSFDRTDADEASADYVGVIREIGLQSRGRQVQLEDDVSDLPAGASIVQASRVAGAASTAELEYHWYLWAYFQSQFGTLLDASPSFVAVIEHRNLMNTALGTVERTAPMDSSVVGALEVVTSSDDVIELAQAVEIAVDDALGGGGEAPVGGDVIIRLVQLSDVFSGAVAGGEAFSDLADAANSEVDAAADLVVAAAEDEFRTTVLLMVGLAVISVAGAIALARYIGRPMVRLADSAERLGTDEEIPPVRRGPSEVRTLGAALRSASRNLVRMEQLEHEATHDELTGLASRRLIKGHLELALARATRSTIDGAVMFVDVDGFKLINDTHGHPAGDLVLRAVSERLRGPLRGTDVVGRYGGDEFLVVADSIASHEAAEVLANRLVEAVSHPVDVSEVSHLPGATTVEVGVSIGVAIFGSADESIEDVLIRADLATYQAKRSHGGAVVAAGPTTGHPQRAGAAGLSERP